MGTSIEEKVGLDREPQAHMVTDLMFENANHQKEYGK